MLPHPGRTVSKRLQRGRTAKDWDRLSRLTAAFVAGPEKRDAELREATALFRMTVTALAPADPCTHLVLVLVLVLETPSHPHAPADACTHEGYKRSNATLRGESRGYPALPGINPRAKGAWHLQALTRTRARTRNPLSPAHAPADACTHEGYKRSNATLRGESRGYPALPGINPRAKGAWHLQALTRTRARTRNPLSPAHAAADACTHEGYRRSNATLRGKLRGCPALPGINPGPTTSCRATGYVPARCQARTLARTLGWSARYRPASCHGTSTRWKLNLLRTISRTPTKIRRFPSALVSRFDSPS